MESKKRLKVPTQAQRLTSGLSALSNMMLPHRQLSHLLLFDVEQVSLLAACTAGCLAKT